MILKLQQGDISGTLTTPNNSKTSPIFLIIAGSSSTDRDCNSPMEIQTNGYIMLFRKFC